MSAPVRLASSLSAEAATSDRVATALRVAALAVAGVGGVAFLWHVARVVAYPFPVNYGEGVVMNLAVLWHTYGTYFFDIGAYPFVHGAYPPLVPAFLSPFTAWPHWQLAVGRAMAAVAAALSALVLYRTHRRAGVVRTSALTFALLFLTPFYVVVWAPLVRVDLLAILFSVAGLTTYVRYAADGSRRRLLAIPLFILAFAAKQNAVAAPLAVALSLVWRDRRELATFTLAYLGSLALSFVIGDGWTGGQFSEHLIALTTFMPLNYRAAPLLYEFFLLQHVGLLFLVARGRRIAARYPAYCWYAVLNAVLLVTITKPGADANYFIELYLSLLLLGGLVFGAVERGDGPAGLPSLRLLLIGLVGQALILLPYGLFADLALHPARPAWHEVRVAVNYQVANATGPVLSEDWGYLILNRRPAFYEPFQFSMFWRYGRSDLQPIIQACERRQFALVVAGPRIRDVPPLARCLARQYREVGAAGIYRFLQPSSQ